MFQGKCGEAGLCHALNVLEIVIHSKLKISRGFPLLKIVSCLVTQLLRNVALVPRVIFQGKVKYGRGTFERSSFNERWRD